MKRTAQLIIASTLLDLAVLDGAAKWWAISSLPVATNIEAVFAFALHKNPGIAFDIPIPLFIVLPLTLVVVAFLARVIGREWSRQPHQALSALAALLGALGNMMDRVINGFTTDYLIFFGTSAINISDILICAGILSYLWYSKKNPQAQN